MYVCASVCMKRRGRSRCVCILLIGQFSVPLLLIPLGPLPTVAPPDWHASCMKGIIEEVRKVSCEFCVLAT